MLLRAVRDGQSLKQGGRVVDHHTEAFVGIDTSKSRNAIAIADGGRGGAADSGMRHRMRDRQCPSLDQRHKLTD
jgi:hypothetical protein